MSQANDPKPGTTEYDAMMMAKYREQLEQKALEKSPLSISYRKAEMPNGVVEVHRSSMQQGEAALTISAADAARQVAKIHQDIAGLREELERRTEEVDPATGQAKFALQGHDRHVRELKLKQLEGATLPYAQQIQQLAEAQEAQEPSLEQRLESERAQQEAIKARAEQIADDEESVQQAIRIVEMRKNARGLK